MHSNKLHTADINDDPSFLKKPKQNNKQITITKNGGKGS